MDKKKTMENVRKCACKCDQRLKLISTENLCQVLGYTDKNELEKTNGRDIINLVYEKDQREFLKTFLYTTKNYGRPAGAFRFVNKDGDNQTLLVSAMIDEADGNISMSFFDPVFAYQESIQTRSRLNMLLDNIQAGIALVEFCDTPKVLFYNKGLEKIVENAQRFSKHKIPLSEAISAFPDDRFPEYAKQALETGLPTEYVFEFTHDDSVHFFRIRSMSVPYDAIENPVFLVIITDITEYKSTEKRLEEMSNELTGVINNVPGGIAMFSIGDDVELEYANDTLFNMISLNVNNYAEISKRELSDFVYPDDYASTEAALMECVKTGMDRECVFRLVALDGKMTWVHVALAANKCEDKRTSVLAVITDISSQQEMSEMMKISQEKFKLAFEQTNATIWEYDINADVVYASVVADYFEEGRDMVVSNPTVELPKMGLICPESAEDFAMLIDMARRGIPKGSCIIKVKLSSVGIQWVELSYVSVFDADGKPSTAVCISKSIDNMSDLQTRFTQEETIFDMMCSTEGVLCVLANLSKDKVLKTHDVQDNDLTDKDVSWTDFMNSDARYTTPIQSANELKKTFGKEALLEGFIEGKDYINKRFKRQDDSGRIKWVSYFINLLTDPISGDVFLFGYIHDVDLVKTAELSLDKNPEFVKKSGLYTLDTVKSMANSIMTKSEDDSQSSVFIIELYDYESKLSGAVKTQLSEKTFLFVVRIIRLIFGGTCIIGDIGDNKLLVFVPSIISHKWLLNTIDKALGTVQMNHSLFGNSNMFDYSVGVCTEPTRSADFDKMVKNANKSLKQAQAHVAVHDEDEDNFAHGSEILSDNNENTDTAKAELFIRCASYMQSNEPLDISINNALKDICHYYHGERAILIEIDDKMKLSNVYEWRESCIDSHKVLIKSTELSDYSVIRRAFDSHKPIIIEDIEMLKSVFEHDELASLDISSLIVIPFTYNNKPAGFIVIGNPAHIDKDIRTLKAISHILISQINMNRLKTDELYAKYHNELTGLLNRTSFNEYIGNFKPDATATVGVLCADINSLKNLNEKYGITYGNEIIKFVADNLRKQFNENELYKFAGDEFVAICENITFDSFEEKFLAVQKKIEETHPGMVSFGHTWANEDIDIEKLVNNAEELMMISKNQYYQSSNVTSRYYDPEKGKELLKSIEEGRFVLFLQPKAKTSTGSIEGAEALVRMMDPEKGLIYPDKFIPNFERQNMIRYIDLFMFEGTLKVLRSWKDQGKRLIPISLNFSRATVLENGIIDTMENIYKNYTDIDRKYVEIEITESMGDMEIETIKHICKGISDMGYRISLDDFGSKYSSVIMLTTIKFNVIKVDKSIIHDIITNMANQILMKNLFHACTDLGIDIVAEGVETQEQFDMLGTLGCTYAQGYLFNKAIPWKEFEEKYITLSD